MTLYLIDHVACDSEASDFQQRLSFAHEHKIRPLCDCNEERPKQPMVIAHYTRQGTTRFIIRRLPDAGRDHAAACPHFQGSAGLSAMEAFENGAIKRNDATGHSTLRLEFPLVQAERRKFEVQDGPRLDPAAPRPKLHRVKATGLLHYLWAQSELTRMSGPMQGHRNWAVVRGRLLATFAKLATARHALSSLAFIPQIFTVEDKARLESLWRMRINDAQTKKQAVLLIGEVKSVDGHAVTIKHLPFVTLRCGEEGRASLARDWHEVQQRRDAAPASRTIALVVLFVSSSGAVLIRDIALMTTTQHWIPFDTMPDYELLTRFDAERRDYDRILSFGTSGALASAMLIDTGDLGTACVIHHSAPTPAQTALREGLQATSQPLWLWNRDEAMPQLPRRGRRKGVMPSQAV